MNAIVLMYYVMQVRLVNDHTVTYGMGYLQVYYFNSKLQSG